MWQRYENRTDHSINGTQASNSARINDLKTAMLYVRSNKKTLILNTFILTSAQTHANTYKNIIEHNR